MTDTLFKEVHYSLGGLINDIGLPDIQRPFVWANAKVRDLFDSMFCGYPVGYFLFWQTGAEGVDSKVIRREAVLLENFQCEHIRIAFRPQNSSFAMSDATTERDLPWRP